MQGNERFQSEVHAAMQQHAKPRTTGDQSSADRGGIAITGGGNNVYFNVTSESKAPAPKPFFDFQRLTVLYFLPLALGIVLSKLYRPWVDSAGVYLPKRLEYVSGFLSLEHFALAMLLLLGACMVLAGLTRYALVLAERR